ncbi:hypothetical protein ARMGADRAFT_1039382 [Armillaria gallica]|uniref:Uncharacterized protein n=1 Tax=Armillaria gallica TaxID=47427 RepID=A0A2H3CHJ5_ARMGA|nr:hypothetical protein ARMGADRAFT_1039382 [Armillaria gallica]
MLQSEDSHQSHEISHPRRKMVNLDTNNEYKFNDKEYSEEFLRSLDEAESDAIAKPFFNPLAGHLSDAMSQQHKAIMQMTKLETTVAPTTQEACHYFFAQIHVFSVKARTEAKAKSILKHLLWNGTGQQMELSVPTSHQKSWPHIQNHGRKQIISKQRENLVFDGLAP